jgi:hypothetical protein
MLGRQSLDEVFKQMCSSRAFIEKLEKKIGKKPDYASLRKLQDDPGFNELSDHVFSMLSPLADTEESALCCILRMRESELRVLQQLHSKLHTSDSSKLVLEADISSRRKIVDILKYALKLNQQENANGIPLAFDNPSDELDTDAANMCQRIVQRRLNFLELIVDGSLDGAQQQHVSCETKHSSINQRLAEAAKNVERSLNSLGNHSELSIQDLDCSSVGTIIPHISDLHNRALESSNETPEQVTTTSSYACHSVNDKSDSDRSCSVVDISDGNRFHLKSLDDQNAIFPKQDMQISASSTHQSTALNQKFEFMTAIPRKSSPSTPLSTAHIGTAIAETISSYPEQRLKGKMLWLHASQRDSSTMKNIAPFAMVKHSANADIIPPTSQLASRISLHPKKGDVLENKSSCSIPPLRKSDIQPSPHKNFTCDSPIVVEAHNKDDLESYCQSKATVLKIRRSSIGSFSQSKGAESQSPIRYIYADLVHSSQNSPSGGHQDRASPIEVVVTRPHIVHTSGIETVRSPRKYEAQVNRLRSSSVGRSPSSDAPLFRESHFPVMKQGSHLELRSPNDRFASAENPLGWV